MTNSSDKLIFVKGGQETFLAKIPALDERNSSCWIFPFFCDLVHTVPQSQGDPKIVKREPNFGQKGDPKGTLFDVKGDLKFDFFRIVHKERIC